MSIIDETWKLLEQRCAGNGVNDTTLHNMKMAYIAALFASSSAIGAEGARSRDISEAAERLEKKR